MHIAMLSAEFPPRWGGMGSTVFHLSGISTLVRNILAPTQGQRISDYLYKFNAIDKYSAKSVILLSLIHISEPTRPY